jgi:hypothetical protein
MRRIKKNFVKPVWRDIMKIKIKCLNCDVEFEDYKCNHRKFCSRKCSNKGRDNSGFTGDAWYKAMSHVDMGKWRGKKRPKHSATMKKLYLEGKIVPWNKGKMNVQSKLYGKDNPGVRSRLKKLGISYDEYMSTWKEDKKRYYVMVRQITENQPIHTLENYDKGRSLAGTPNGYQLDHIISIGHGFENKIPPNVIGNIENLQFIKWEDNLRKQ